MLPASAGVSEPPPAHLAAALSSWELSRLCEEPRPAHELIVLEEALDLRQEAFVDSFQPWTSKVSCAEPNPFVHPRLINRSSLKRKLPAGW